MFSGEVRRLPRSSQIDLERFMREVLPYTPRTRIPGKTKPLRGEYRGYWEYKLARFKRLIYFPDDDTMTVYIEYLGPHPNWEKLRRRRGLS